MGRDKLPCFKLTAHGVLSKHRELSSAQLLEDEGRGRNAGVVVFKEIRLMGTYLYKQPSSHQAHNP